MGGGPSKSRTPSPPHPKARPKTLVSKLDGATRAFDLIQLTDQDTVRLAKEARVQAVVSELERGHDAVLVEVTTRHVAEVEELVEAHQRRVEALYAERSGLFTPLELELSSGLPGAGEDRGRTSPPLTAQSGRLPQSVAQSRLVELGVMIAALPAGREGGLQTGLVALAALDRRHADELEELERQQQKEVDAASLQARLEKTEALFALDQEFEKEEQAAAEAEVPPPTTTTTYAVPSVSLKGEGSRAKESCGGRSVRGPRWSAAARRPLRVKREGTAAAAGAEGGGLPATDDTQRWLT